MDEQSTLKELKEIPVVWLPANTDACAMYRMFMPSLSVPRSKYLYELGPIQVSKFGDAKIAVVQRQVSDSNKIALMTIKEAGIKIVYDLDDNIWNLPSFNPGKKVFDAHQDGFLQCAELADILTVSTIGLRTAAKTGFKFYNKEIEVVPNAINLNMFRSKDIKKYDDQVVIGWGGSNTHSVDTALAFESVREVLDDNKKAKLHIVGAPALDTLTKTEILEDGRKRLYREVKASPIAKHPQTEFKPWVPIGEYPSRFASWGWDIALAPLDDNRFNKSKSNIKCLEAAAIKIPCLCSDVQPYYEFCSLGGQDLKWLLCRTHNDWVSKLNTLINDEAMRNDLGQKMYDVTNRFFNMDSVKANWMHTFNKVMSC